MKTNQKESMTEIDDYNNQFNESDDDQSYDSDENITNRSRQFYKLPDYLKFAMNPIGERICINAVTGQPYFNPSTNKVIYQNTIPSRQLFQVIDTTAPIGNKDPYKLYYDTPEQYERHRGFKISKSIKNTWREKMTNLGYSPYGIGTANIVPDVKETTATMIQGGVVTEIKV